MDSVAKYMDDPDANSRATFLPFPPTPGIVNLREDGSVPIEYLIVSLKPARIYGFSHAGGQKLYTLDTFESTPLSTSESSFKKAAYLHPMRTFDLRIGGEDSSKAQGLCCEPASPSPYTFYHNVQLDLFTHFSARLPATSYIIPRNYPPSPPTRHSWSSVLYPAYHQGTQPLSTSSPIIPTRNNMASPASFPPSSDPLNVVGTPGLREGTGFVYANAAVGAATAPGSDTSSWQIIWGKAKALFLRNWANFIRKLRVLKEKIHKTTFFAPGFFAAT
ncbi:unnamed protein product [Cyclocybe aegerita]|uniref:Uncharacterized protein n=1 Tax=Cyclocybe aegerita TaxID=1973307 RepID=A0A8S0W3I5_CYCAE|nr:unnamed protein product [Cyclocybe aegerita]